MSPLPADTARTSCHRRWAAIAWLMLLLGSTGCVVDRNPAGIACAESAHCDTGSGYVCVDEVCVLGTLDSDDRDDDGDGQTENEGDCDDEDPAIYDGATEACDATDSDCDGSLTDGEPDLDGDGTPDCVDPDDDGDGVDSGPDCDDRDETLGARAEDADCDGVLTAADCDDSDADSTTVAEDLDCDGVLSAADCDDQDEGVGAFATDADCDGTPIDDDCDDSDPSSTTVATDEDCDGAVAEEDCDDLDAMVLPGAAEFCDEIDSDCDGSIVDEDADLDEDGTPDCVDDDADGDGYETNVDCDDADPSAYNGATESCDAVDSDCDGSVTDEFADLDGDDLPDCVDEDADGDGTPSAGDCDDLDALSTLVAEDGDCDGTLGAADCDDTDPASTTLATDGDCDGTVTAEDCDDAAPLSNTIATDGDCDGVLTADDCDDTDAFSTTVSTDGDCDGTLAPEDCDDADPDSTVLSSDFECDGLVDCLGSITVQGAELIALCSGTFEMGCTAGQSSCYPDESPPHTVTLTRRFYLGETEVTQGQWIALMGNNPSGHPSCGPDCPLEGVTWWDALAFANALSAAAGLDECYTLGGCTTLPGNDMECADVTVNAPGGSAYECAGYRLPTEAEWEYAARGGQDLLYSGSDIFDDVAWNADNSGSTPHEVGTKLPNAFGLYDMNGNVSEWTQDWFGSLYYSTSPLSDPEGPATGTSRVQRGGGWPSHSWSARVAYRGDYPPGNRFDSLGLRIARTVPGVPGDADGDGSPAGLDCDDDDAAVHPGAPELCDGLDSDCNGLADADPEGEADADLDGALSCDDCDDADPLVAPDVFEGLGAGNCSDGVDNNCDGEADGALECPPCGSSTPTPGGDLVHVCAGTFEMGCTAGQSGCGSDELPAHTVTISRGFWLGGTEVTQGQWSALMGNNPAYFGPVGPGPDCSPDCPMEWVTWWESLAFANAVSAAEGLAECYALSGCVNSPGDAMECSGLTVNSADGDPASCEGYRLPTEAEWEYAARGGQDLLYSGSGVLDDVGWYGANSAGTPHPVGSKQPNGYGLYDMSGNVWEWTQDWYDGSYYSASPSTDPVGPAAGSQRSIRGGDWFSVSGAGRAANRGSLEPSTGGSALGFRLARTVPYLSADIDADGDGSPASLDCDDADATTYPGAPELCDGLDSDCDGLANADVDGEVDADADGALSCDDCDDAEPLAGPALFEGMGAENCWDGLDNDCDGAADGADECPPCGASEVAQGLGLIHVCAGTFEMGCTAGQSSCDADESPAHTVTLSRGFWLAETEVTQGQWSEFMGNNPAYFGPVGPGADCGADCPMEWVNWWEALSLANAVSAAEGLPECYVLSGCVGTPGAGLECTGLSMNSPSGYVVGCEGYRLPTEAEWEHAARGGQDLLYSGSDVLDDVGWHAGNSPFTPQPVGSKQPNALGLYDMSGNVWEWTQDRYESTYYSTSPSTDPGGPSPGDPLSIRGGSFDHPEVLSRVSCRSYGGSGARGAPVGFRLARTVP